MAPEAKAAKANINKLEYIKLKSFCTSKEIINKIFHFQQHTEGEKTFANHISDKWLTFKIYKELMQLNSKTKYNLKMGRESE